MQIEGEREAGCKGGRGGKECIVYCQSKGSQVKVEKRNWQGSKGVGNGKNIKRGALDRETDKKKTWMKSRDDEKREKGNGGEKVRDPRELYLWRRVVMLEDSPGNIYTVFNEEGGAGW